MTVFSSNPSTGIGTLQSVPGASANGTALGTMPDGAVGARFYLPTGASVTFTITDTAPASPPTALFTVSQASSGPNWDETLSAGQMIYLTALSGAPLFRWF